MLVIIALTGIVLNAGQSSSQDTDLQGIHVEARRKSEVTLLSPEGEESAHCEVRPTESCFLPVDPGRRTFLVNRARLQVNVRDGESRFRVVNVPYAGAISGAIVIGLGGAALVGAQVVASSGGISVLPFAYGLLFSGFIMPAVGLVLIIVDLLRPHTLLVPLARPTALRIRFVPGPTRGWSSIGVQATF